MSLFKKAVKSQSKLRLAIDGVSGSGKTYSSLAIATALGKRVAVIDTENGSAEKYAGIFDFDCLKLNNFSPVSYIEAIQAACKEGYDVVVVDSLSHGWFGSGGVLDLHTAAEKRQKTPNSWTAWKDVTPMQNKLIETMIRAPIHIIVTLRVKTKHEQVIGSDGRSKVQKLGLDPIQKDGLEYEFDVYGSMNLDNELIISKTRCPELSGKFFLKPGAEFAQILKDWITDGVPVTEKEEFGKDSEWCYESQKRTDFRFALLDEKEELLKLLYEVPSDINARVMAKLPPQPWSEETFIDRKLVLKAIEFLKNNLPTIGE